jgi:hypothetical protein
LLAIWRSCYRLSAVIGQLYTTGVPEPSRSRGGLGAALLAFICSCLPTVNALAHDAAYRVALLELESDSVHDDFAGLLTERLRAALSERSGYELLYAPVSLAQLSLAHNCDTSHADCLAMIARELKLDGFVFGKVTHEGGAPVALLRRYDLKGESVDRSALVTFASLDADRDELERGAQELLTRLLNTPQVAGPRPQPIAARTRAVAALPATSTSEPASGVSGQSVAAYSLLAASVLSAGMAVASFIWVDQSEHNANFNDYRLAVGDQKPSVRDVCTEASANRNYGLAAASFRDVKSSCSMGTTFEVLQYVFIAGAVLTGGLATYLLASDDSTERKAGTALSLHPSLARGELGMRARLAF